MKDCCYKVQKWLQVMRKMAASPTFTTDNIWPEIRSIGAREETTVASACLLVPTPYNLKTTGVLRS